MVPPAHVLFVANQLPPKVVSRPVYLSLVLVNGFEPGGKRAGHFFALGHLTSGIRFIIVKARWLQAVRTKALGEPTTEALFKKHAHVIGYGNLGAALALPGFFAGSVAKDLVL